MAANQRGEGDDLVADISLKMTESILGTKREIAGLKGDKISVEIPERTVPGTILRMREKGIPGVKRGKTGDLLFKISFEQPQKVSKKVKELLNALQNEGL